MKPISLLFFTLLFYYLGHCVCMCIHIYITHTCTHVYHTHKHTHTLNYHLLYISKLVMIILWLYYIIYDMAQTVFIKSKLHIFNFIGLIQFYDKKKTHLKKWKKNWPMRGQVTRVVWGSPWSLCFILQKWKNWKFYTRLYIMSCKEMSNSLYFWLLAH